MAFKFITAEEAAEFIHHNDNVGFSGFTAAGTPKVVSVALAKKAEAEHAAGRPFQIGVYTGASTSDYIDGALSRAKAIKSRTPYQSHKDSREAINNNEIAYFDLHLSHLAQTLRYGFLGKVRCRRHRSDRCDSRRRNFIRTRCRRHTDFLLSGRKNNYRVEPP